QLLLAARKLQVVAGCSRRHAFGRAEKPFLVAVRAAPVSHRSFVVRKVEPERIVFGDAAHLRRARVVPADEIDGVGELVAVGTSRADRLAVFVPRRFERLRVAVRVRRTRTRNEAEDHVPWRPCITVERRLLADERELDRDRDAPALARFERVAVPVFLLAEDRARIVDAVRWFGGGAAGDENRDKRRKQREPGTGARRCANGNEPARHPPPPPPLHPPHTAPPHPPRTAAPHPPRGVASRCPAFHSFAAYRRNLPGDRRESATNGRDPLQDLRARIVAAIASAESPASRRTSSVCAPTGGTGPSRAGGNRSPPSRKPTGEAIARKSFASAPVPATSQTAPLARACASQTASAGDCTGTHQTPSRSKLSAQTSRARSRKMPSS